MYHIVDSAKSFDQATADLEAAVKRHGFGVLHVHDLGATLRGKGISFPEKCRVLEVCNPVQAARVLDADMRLNMALPCRISVYTEKDQTRIGFLKPVQMLAGLSLDPVIAEIAREVEGKVLQMVMDAR